MLKLTNTREVLMEKVEKILQFYVLTNKLKDTIRTSWKYWNVKKSRLESVAEHVYGTCMLAIAVWSETLPPVNIADVLMTLAIHETEEIIIGDLTPFDKEYKDKKALGKEAVKKVFNNLIAKEVYLTLIKNFEDQSTPEALFAYKIDKLECDLQAKLYDEKGFMKFENVDAKVKNDERIKKLGARGVKNPSTFFLYLDRPNLQKGLKEKEEDIFVEISKYVEKNKISGFATTTTAKVMPKTDDTKK